MKISLNWVKQFTEIDLPIDELVAKISSQLGEVEEVIDLGARYKSALVVRVVDSYKHPNADKLTVCLVEDGGVVEGIERNQTGLISIVCGAPNVRNGMLAVWLPPGSTVPSTYDKTPFVLEARDLRGVMSNGMLASAQELAIGDDHSGIVEVDIDSSPGSSFAELYELNDYIFDIENKMFTHRPDCFGILGVAREIAGIVGQPFKSPDWYLKQELSFLTEGSLTVGIDNQVPDLVPRFVAVALLDISSNPAPLIIRSYLARIGIKPISGVVDVTNYLMALTGQPLHAYDYDKLPQPGQLGARRSKKGDSLKLISGKTIKFDDDQTILITSGDVPVGIGGVMGGADTEVDETTKNIVIEVATFDMYSIRRTSMRHGLFTDAVTRYTKGQSPQQNGVVLAQAVEMLTYIAGARFASEMAESKANISPQPEVEVTAGFVNDRLGLDLAAADMADILRNVEFKVELRSDRLEITPPFWRTDIHIPEDIVEEIGRLYGYDRLPQKLPVRTIAPVDKNPDLMFADQVRSKLSRAGANEVLRYTFVHGDLMQKTTQDPDRAFKLNNAISPDIQYYRLGLTSSLLESVHGNIKSGHDEFALFEINKVFEKGKLGDDNLPSEYRHVGLVFAAESKTATEKYHGAPYYQAKQFADILLKNIPEVSLITLEAAEEIPQWMAPYEPSRSATIRADHEIIGVVGEFKANVRRELKLPDFCAGFEMRLDKLQAARLTNPYRALSKFPKVAQDITLRVTSDVAHAELEQVCIQALEEFAPKDCEYSLTTTDIYQADNQHDQRHVTFHLEINSQDRTLTAGEVNSLLDSVAQEAGDELDAIRI